MSDLFPSALFALLAPGAIVFVGFAVIFIKFSPKWKTRLLGKPLLCDLAVASVAFMLHGGSTYSGGMAATVAAILTALGTWVGAYIFGKVEGGMYYPGLVKYSAEDFK